VISIAQKAAERLLKTLWKSEDFQAEYSLTAAATVQMATISECRYRCLRVPATTDSCDIGAGDPEGSPFAFWEPFRKDRVLRLRATRLSRKRQIEPWRPSGRWIWNDIHIPS
jgi:hypothetical protein